MIHLEYIPLYRDRVHMLGELPMSRAMAMELFDLAEVALRHKEQLEHMARGAIRPEQAATAAAGMLKDYKPEPTCKGLAVLTAV